MRVLSLFDGISCAQVALNRIGVDIEEYIASEIDPDAIKVTQKNYPDTIQIGDVRKIKINDDCFGDDWVCINQHIDLLIGGSPCQDISIAKMNRDRSGLSGQNSSLFWEYVRIKNELNPTHFLLENVERMPNDVRDIFTKELGVQPIMIDAQLVSAQRRRRLFWTNIPNVTQPEDRHIYLKDIVEFGSENVESVAKRNKNRSKHQSIGGKYGDFPKEYHLEPERNGKSFCVKSATQEFMVRDGVAVRHATPIECERLQGLPDNYTSGFSKTRRYKMLGNAFNVDVVSHILSFIR